MRLSRGWIRSYSILLYLDDVISVGVDPMSRVQTIRSYIKRPRLQDLKLSPSTDMIDPMDDNILVHTM